MIFAKKAYLSFWTKTIVKWVHKESFKQIISRKSMFSGIEIKSMTDLTALPEFGNLQDLEDHSSKTTFRQIIHIELERASKQNVLDIIKKLERVEGIRYVGPDLVEKGLTPTPNDTRLLEQWGLVGTNGISARTAWGITAGSRNVRVGIIDSGIQAHNDLNTNVSGGWDFTNVVFGVPSTTLRQDIGGHGTSVAGIIGAVGNNGIGISGVAQLVTLVPMQTAHDTSGSGLHNTSAIIAAITHARNLWNTNQRISIINYSLSGFGTNIVILDAVETFQGLFVWSAGNNGDHVNDFTNIDRFNPDNLISVGAHNSSGSRSIWISEVSSNYGNAVNVWAPGGEGTTQTTLNCLTTHSTSEANYRFFNGTSAAAPYVTGTAALMLAVNPNLTTAQLKTAIINNSDNVANFTTPSGTHTIRKLNAGNIIGNVTFTSSNIGYNEISFTGVHRDIILSNSLTIPEFLNSRTVTQIGSNVFSGQNQLSQITIPASVTHIGNNAFQNTNNAPIYLEGRTSTPSTFDINWNSSGNPVYLNGNLCTHTSTTFMSINYNQHGRLCNTCRTFVNKSNHNHNVEHIPLGTAPSGIAMHASYCACGHSVTVPCVSRFPHLPGDMVICMYCGQEFSNPVFMMTLPNGESFVSNAPFTYDMFEQLVEHLELSYAYADFVVSTRSNIVYDDYAVKIASILPSRKEIVYECCE